jgi:hypothetical protein
MSNYSIYIPRVFNNISNQKIISAFEKYDIGTISSIDVKLKTGLDGSCYKVVFIHFSHWNAYNSSAINLRERIENPEKEARLIYDDPWYWILLPNTSGWKQEDICQPHLLSLEACYERISHMENELTSIYKQLHNKRYVPVNYSNCMETNDIESCSPNSDSETQSNMSPMTIDDLMVDAEQGNVYNPYVMPMKIDELEVVVIDLDDDINDDGELHKPPTPPLNNNNLSKISCEYDCEYDLESGCSGCSAVDYGSGSSVESKLWMTVNFCGND